MPGIVAVVSAISSSVVAGLAAAGYPALTDGAILLGRQYQYEGSAPPRIVFIPTSSDFSAKDVYARQGVPTAAQLTNRSILSDVISFEVRCWGSSPSGDPSQDYDYTQALYQQVIRSVNELTYGSYVCGRGTWTDGRLNDSQLIRDGREFVFTVTLSTPVLERIEALPFAPPDVAPGVTDTLVLSNGQSGPGCEE